MGIKKNKKNDKRRIFLSIQHSASQRVDVFELLETREKK